MITFLFMESITENLDRLLITDKKETIEDESIRIEEILSQLKEIKFNDSYSIANEGIDYHLGNDSKILSKIYELILINKLKLILDSKGIEYIENEVQNKYPDFIIKSKVEEDRYYAVDIKSSYLKSEKNINGFTLGTYKGYFRNRDSLKSIVIPYSKFHKHYCVCVIYERTEEKKTPVKFILVREKWRLASKSTGSGNTCNIGSIKTVSKLTNDEALFESKEEFNSYWLGFTR